MFPDAYIDGRGLTPFKIYSEYRWFYSRGQVERDTQGSPSRMSGKPAAAGLVGVIAATK